MPIDLRSLARLGAQARLAELVAEQEAILGAFPDLGTQGSMPAPTPQRPVAVRKRPRMSAAQRKAVSERMTRYWQRWREAAPKTVAKASAKRSPWTPAKRRAAAERARQMWKEGRKAIR